MGIRNKKTLKSWRGNFTYKAREFHGKELHFTGVTAQKAMVLLRYSQDGKTFQVVDVSVGAEFHCCTFETDTGALRFCVDPELPALHGQKCSCCDELSKPILEDLTPVHKESTTLEQIERRLAQQ